MTLLVPAADRVVREAVDAVLEGRSHPGSGSDVSFATRSSRYRVIHGVLREASDASLVGARFVGWLFDGTREPTLGDRWDTDARAVLIDEAKGQIVVTSLTRVHVANALAANALPTEDGRGSAVIGGDGFPSRAGTLHGLPVVDPEPSQEIPIIVEAAPEVAPTPAVPPPPPPEPEAPALATPSPPQATSPMPKRTIPPAPPIPGRQATPIPLGRPATPMMPVGRMGTPMMPMRPVTPPHPGTRTQPMAVMPPPKSGAGGPPPPPPPPPSRAPSTHLGLGSSPVRAPSTHLGLAPATRFPPGGPQEPIILNEPLMTSAGPVDVASLEEVSALLSVTGEVSAAIAPPLTVEQVEGPAQESDDAPPPAPSTGGASEADAGAMPVPATGPGWAGKSAPLPQFDLDDADLDLPTRTDPLPPAPPSEEEAVIPLIPRG